MRCNVLFSLVLGTAVLVPEVLSANCADGPGYGSDVSGRTVTICLGGGDVEGRDACSFGGGMLRENVETGEIVRLAQHHVEETDGFEEDGYHEYCCLDECVEPGEYRYGLAEPFDCVSASCGSTPYYEEIEVTASGLACTLSEDNPGVTAYSGDAPWKGDNDGLVCVSSYADGPFSCAVAHPGAKLVFGFNALFALLGLTLFVWRRALRRA